MQGLGDLQEIHKEVSLQDILIAMLDGDENLDLKTRIINPKDLASLKIVGSILKSHKMDRSHALIKKFLKTYLRYMVSWEGRSRQEIITALTGLLEQQQAKITVTDRLTSNLKNE